MTITPTHLPAIYFPIENDSYEVKPGLTSLCKDFGNGQQDQNVFQFDNSYSRYRENKQLGREEDIAKYFCTDNFTTKQQSTINQFIIKQLSLEHPGYFTHEKGNTEHVLNCKLNDENIVYNKQSFQLSNNTTSYKSLFDALAMQLQEDIAVIIVEPENTTIKNNHLTALHLFAPNHWAAADKIGKNFIEVHHPVAGMEQINKNQSTILKAIINKGPFVRFAWGLSTDDRLNHHPIAPQTLNRQDWHGRKFIADKSKLFLRVERQTLHGFASINSVLFTIRTYFYTIEQLSAVNKITVIKALKSMTQNQLVYKELLHDRDAIIQYLYSIS